MKLSIDVNKFMKDLQSYGPTKDLITIIKSLFFDCIAEIEPIESKPETKLLDTKAKKQEKQALPTTQQEAPKVEEKILTVDGGSAETPSPVEAPPNVTQYQKSPLAKKLSAFIVPNELSGPRG